MAILIFRTYDAVETTELLTGMPVKVTVLGYLSGFSDFVDVKVTGSFQDLVRVAALVDVDASEIEV